MSQLSDAAIRRLRPGLDALPPVTRTIEDDTLTETRRFRGVTMNVATKYLENLGGERLDGETVEGDGWRAELTTRKAPVGPSYRLTEIEITWTGDPEILEPIIYGFRLKTFRAPG